MGNEKDYATRGPSLTELYPQLSKTKLQEAGENLGRYAALAIRVFNRLEAERSEASPDLALTAPESDATDGMFQSPPNRPSTQ